MRRELIGAIAGAAVVLGAVLAWRWGDLPGALGWGIVVMAVGVAASRASTPAPRDDDGEQTRALVAERDRARLETITRNQILGAMTEAVLLVDADETVVYANRAAEAMLGAREGRPPPAIIPRDDDAPATFEVHHPARRTMRAVTSNLDDGQTLIVAQDVTETERIDQVRRDFVANVSHEMKTPLGGILATAETLRGAIEHDPAAATGFAATLVAEATRLARLLDDLLDLARLEGPRDVRTSVALTTIVTDEVERARPAASDRRIALTADVAPGLTVLGDPQDLAQAVRNLVTNAISYTGEGGTVTVTLEGTSRAAILRVADTGIGIPARDLPRIFERFYRVDRARSRETGGTGLGLSIVRNAIEAHGGTVRAESELGRGSTFTVELPLVD